MWNESKQETHRFHCLRQQKTKVGSAQNYYSLSDFVAPESLGKMDTVGFFCVTAGKSVEEYAATYLKELDDYSSILVKAIGDRFAEATAEWLHLQVRREMGSSEQDPTIDSLLEEKYEGIRPALGYPACPDHSEKQTLWKILKPDEKIGVTLTDSFAMNPPSSVSGLYFFSPESRYFNVGTIGADQLQNYADRKRIPVELARKRLGSHLT